MFMRKNIVKSFLFAIILFINGISFAQFSNSEQVWNLLTEIEAKDPSNQVITYIKNETSQNSTKQLNQLSGEFIINALRLGMFSDDLNSIFSTVINKNSGNIHKAIWGQFLINNNHFGEDNANSTKFKDNDKQAIIGFSLIERSKIILGVYGIYNNISISQGSDEGKINRFVGGIYSGIIDEIIKLRLSADAGLWNINTTRNIRLSNYEFRSEADFRVYVIRAALELDLSIPISQNGFVSPFVGGHGAFIKNNQIKEKTFDSSSNLVIDADSYTSFVSLIGLKLGRQADSGVNWTLKTYYAYLAAGENFKYTVSFVDAQNLGSMQIASNDKRETYIGSTLNLDFILSDRVSIFVNAVLNSNVKFNDFTNNIGMGMKIRIGQSPPQTIEPEISTDTMPIQDGEALPNMTIDQSTSTISDEAELIGEENIRAYLRSSEDEQLRAEEERLGIVRDPQKTEKEQLEQVRQRLIAEIKRRVAEARSRRRKELIKTFNMDLAKFETGSYILTQSAKEFIKQLAGWISEYEYTQITIEGHTDSTGDLQTNLLLSSLRAKAVRDELHKNGIVLEKIFYIGYGPSMPIASNKTVSGKLKNRRVELFVE
jgi:outer membrane autotransporter protein